MSPGPPQKGGGVLFKGILEGLLKGIYKGSIKGLGFPKLGVPYFGGPYNKDPTI